jgi:hypothetical protein
MQIGFNGGERYVNVSGNSTEMITLASGEVAVCKNWEIIIG